jgi:hypothetical protein
MSKKNEHKERKEKNSYSQTSRLEKPEGKKKRRSFSYTIVPKKSCV